MRAIRESLLVSRSIPDCAMAYPGYELGFLAALDLQQHPTAARAGFHIAVGRHHLVKGEYLVDQG